MAYKKLGKSVFSNTSLFICDMQEKFRPTIQYFPQITQVITRLLGSADVLGMPIIVTEQYPKGLGHTISELDVKKYPVFSKTSFSMLIPPVEEELNKMKNINSIVLCGIEAHACVQQTALDLIEKDYEVHVIVDACSSRNMVDRMFAYKRMANAGAYLTTSESILLGLLKDASHPKFREVQKFMMESSPDSGLLDKFPKA